MLEELLSLTAPLKRHMIPTDRKVWQRISAECADLREHTDHGEGIPDEKLDQMEREAKAFLLVTEVLKKVDPEKRLRVMRCASILTLGKDLDELGGAP